MNVFVRARARTCIRIARARALNFQAASRARVRTCTCVRVSLLRGFACVSGLLRVREERVHRANASDAFFVQDVLYICLLHMSICLLHRFSCHITGTLLKAYLFIINIHSFRHS